MVAVPRPFDIVVTTNSGYPLDINLYQSVKGMRAADPIVRPGGAIIIAASCWDGIPEHGLYGKILRESRDSAGAPGQDLRPGISRAGPVAGPHPGAHPAEGGDLRQVGRPDGRPDPAPPCSGPCRRIEDTIAELLDEIRPRRLDLRHARRPADHPLHRLKPSSPPRPSNGNSPPLRVERSMPVFAKDRNDEPPPLGRCRPGRLGPGSVLHDSAAVTAGRIGPGRPGLERIGPAGGRGAHHIAGRDRICGSEVLPDFYRAREFRPAWIDDGLVLADAVALPRRPAPRRRGRPRPRELSPGRPRIPARRDPDRP